MRSFWFDPYLWIHLAGIASLPIWLELCLLGLAVGDPLLPVWLEIGLIGIAGIAPILWMQWQRPFYIFSLMAVALKPEQLTEDQRRLLTLFKSQRNRILAISSAVLLFIVVQKLYYVAPIAASIAPFAPNARLLGLLLAAIAFLGANLFLQVPVSVLSVMLTGEANFTATSPYAIDQVRQNFSLLGFPVNQILPPVVVQPVNPAPGSVASGEMPTISTPSKIPTSPSPQLSAPSVDGMTNPIASTNDTSESELDDVWGVEEEAPPSNAHDSAVQDTVAELETIQPDEKPDLASMDMKTEEAKTEEDIL